MQLWLRANSVRSSLLALVLVTGVSGHGAWAEPATDDAVRSFHRVLAVCERGDTATGDIPYAGARMFITCVPSGGITAVATVDVAACAALARAVFGPELAASFSASDGAPARAPNGQIIRTFGICELTLTSLDGGEGG